MCSPTAFNGVNLAKRYDTVVTRKQMIDIDALFRQIDRLWVKRKRILDTLTVVKVLHQSAIFRRGLAHVLEMTNIAPVSAAAVCKARHKIPLGAFRSALSSVADQVSGTAGTRVLAVDGSKVHVPPSLSEPRL